MELVVHEHVPRAAFAIHGPHPFPVLVGVRGAPVRRHERRPAAVARQLAEPGPAAHVVARRITGEHHQAPVFRSHEPRRAVGDVQRLATFRRPVQHHLLGADRHLNLDRNDRKRQTAGHSVDAGGHGHRALPPGLQLATAGNGEGLRAVAGPRGRLAGQHVAVRVLGGRYQLHRVTLVDLLYGTRHGDARRCRCSACCIEGDRSAPRHRRGDLIGTWQGTKPPARAGRTTAVGRTGGRRDRAAACGHGPSDGRTRDRPRSGIRDTHCECRRQLPAHRSALSVARHNRDGVGYRGLLVAAPSAAATGGQSEQYRGEHEQTYERQPHEDPSLLRSGPPGGRDVPFSLGPIVCLSIGRGAVDRHRGYWQR